MSTRHIANAIQLPATEAPAWVQLAVVGEWRGHSRPYKVTTERLAAMKAHFDERCVPNGKGLVVDFDHASILVRAGKAAPGTAAAGAWIDQMVLGTMPEGADEPVANADAGELWGHVDWTGRGRKAVESSEYGYLSPVFQFNVPHPVTGARVAATIDSVALTNTPFLRELAAVANADDAHTLPTAFQGFAVEYLVKGAEEIEFGGPTPSQHAAAVAEEGAFVELRRKWLTQGLTVIVGRYQETEEWDIQGFRFDEEEWSPERAQQWLDEHAIQATVQPATQEASNTVDTKELATKIGIAEDADQAAINAKLDELVANAAATPLAPVANALGLSDTSDGSDQSEAILNTIGELKAKADAAPAGDGTLDLRVVAVANSLGLDAAATADQLVASLNALKGGVQTSAAEQLVGAAVKDGKLPPADKGYWLNAITVDPEGTERIINAMTPVLAQATGGTPPPGDNDPEISPEQKRINAQLGVSDEEFIADQKAANSA